MSEEIEYTDEEKALAAFLECEPNELELEDFEHYGLNLYSLGSKQYTIGTDSECDSAAYKSIVDSAWAFNADFIQQHADIPYEAIEMIQKFQEKCEDANDTILALIKKGDGIDKFVSDAIGADGRGHFLSGYDGEEQEQECNGTTYYIYRVN